MAALTVGLHDLQPTSAAAADHAAWRQQLAGIPGLDIDHGLALMHGNAIKHARMLTIFAESHAEDAMRLSERLTSNDLAALGQLAHTLKGSAGTIGATRVAEAAAALHSALRAGAERDETDTRCNTLIAELMSLIDGIRQAVSTARHAA